MLQRHEVHQLTNDVLDAHRAREERRRTDYVSAEQVQLASRLRQQRAMPRTAADERAAEIAARGETVLRSELDKLERERYGGQTVAEYTAEMTGGRPSLDDASPQQLAASITGNWAPPTAA
ncbi:hypothetical protein [Streptomyces pristinaespiralis]|uniref:hypothetical protein n=1 Tax=Streptomyces pristinaespiralis TaxID=38300 RepID=UPI003832B1F1